MSILPVILDLLFPPRCVFCHCFLERSTILQICCKCAKSLPETINGGKQKGDFFDFCVSPLYYEGDVRESIRRFKFAGCSGYAGTYAHFLAACIKSNADGEYDLITWAPLSSKRLRKRGYDQTKLIAEQVARELGSSAVNTLKKREVPAQSGIKAEAQRKANISGAYTVTDPALVKDKRILIIDDVITTGSTLSECSRMLLMAGADRVICAALARKH